MLPQRCLTGSDLSGTILTSTDMSTTNLSGSRTGYVQATINPTLPAGYFVRSDSAGNNTLLVLK